MNSRKLLLINTVDKTTTHERFFVPLSGIPAFQPIALGILAALTPKHWDIDLIDENFEDFVDTDAELVGISAYSTSINRAIQISQKLRKKGITTILGGKHASFFPEEVQKYFNTVVTGEAEKVWKNVISDYENNTLKPLYEGYQFPLSESIRPRRDIFDKYNYVIASVQFARGCVYNCSFCSVPVFYKHTYRQREIEDVIQELREIKQRYVFLVDDNIVCKKEQDRERIKKLFEEIYSQKIDKYFMCAASIDIADDEELLMSCKKAGVKVLYIGIESEKINSLRSVNKRSNYNQANDFYKNALKKIHKYKISVMAGFICGFDDDTKQDIENRVKYILKGPVDFFTLTFITPLPKTKLYEQYDRENRLLYKNFPADWIYYNSCNVTTITKSEDYKVLSEAYYYSSIKIIRCKVLLRKIFWTLLRTRSLITAYVLLVFETKMHVYLGQHWFVKLIVRK